MTSLTRRGFNILGMGFALRMSLGARPRNNLAPPAILASFAARSAVYQPSPALSDAPMDEGLNLKLTCKPGKLYRIPMAVWLDKGVDVSDSTLMFDFKPLRFVENIDVLGIELYSAGSPGSLKSNFHQVDRFGAAPSALRQILTSMAGGAAVGRRQTLGIPASQFSAVGSGANLGAIKGVRLLVRSKGSAAPLTMMLGPIRVRKNALSKARAIIAYDDAHAVQYTTAFPLHRARGFPAVLHPGAIDLVMDKPGRLSTSQAREMVDAGWQWAYQARSSEEKSVIDAMTDAQRDAEMTGQFAFAKTHGLGPYSRYGSYFSGVGRNDLISFGMFRKNLHATRAHFLPNSSGAPIHFGETYPWPDPMIVRAMAGDAYSGSIGQERLSAHLAQTVRNRGVMLVNYHDNLESLPGLLAMLDAQRDQIEVTTESSLSA